MGFNPSSGATPAPAHHHDVVLDRKRAIQFAAEHGWDGFLDALEGKAACILGYAPDLYSVSTEWVTDPSITKIKARGANGDVLVWLV